MSEQPSLLKKCRLGILLSGRGSNFQAIHQAIIADSNYPAEIAAVVSNRSSAAGLSYAEENGIPAAALRPKDYESLRGYEEAVLSVLTRHDVDLLILAGYTKILGAVLLSAYAGRTLNIHPSLLPAYGGEGMWGERVHQAVIAAGERESGCSVHLVTEDVDAGPVIAQACVTVTPQDTPETLAARILTEEHRLYPRAIKTFIQSHPEALTHARHAQSTH